MGCFKMRTGGIKPVIVCTLQVIRPAVADYVVFAKLKKYLYNTHVGNPPDVNQLNAYVSYGSPVESPVNITC